MCLTHQTTEKDPRQGSPLSSRMDEAMEKTGQRGLLIAATRGSNKDTNRAISPAVEAVCVSAHLALPGSPKPSTCTSFTLNSHWDRAAPAKKSLASMHARSLWLCPTLHNHVDCGLPGFSVREGVLQARILEGISQYWLPYPSRALYFLLP